MASRERVKIKTYVSITVVNILYNHCECLFTSVLKSNRTIFIIPERQKKSELAKMTIFLLECINTIILLLLLIVTQYDYLLHMFYLPTNYVGFIFTNSS